MPKKYQIIIIIIIIIILLLLLLLLLLLELWRDEGIQWLKTHLSRHLDTTHSNEIGRM